MSAQRGEVGSSVSTEEAYLAARETMLHILAIIQLDIDLDDIESKDKMMGLVRSAQDFTEQPDLINGASDLLMGIFGENGCHARTATGVAQLPYGASVQLELVMRLKHVG